MANGYEIPGLFGERIGLRPLEPAEAAVARQWVMESDPLFMSCRLPGLSSMTRSAEMAQTASPEPLRFNLGMILRGTGTLVGRVTTFDYNPRNRSCEIGYIVAPTARGKGYGREAVAILLDYLFGGVGLNKVQAQTGSFNAPSIRLLETLGFKRDAVLREHHLYKAVLHDDYVYSIVYREWHERGRI